MLKRTVVLSSASKVTLRNNQLVCANQIDETDIKTAPIEDLGAVIVENPRCTLSIPVMTALADNNTAVIFCDNRLMPCSMLVSLSANATQSAMLLKQAGYHGKPKNKQLWKQIVESKIRNQSNLLDKLGKDGRILKPFYSNVKSGDIDNREGIAARLYWNELFCDSFSRDRDGDAPNNMLNYGYAILRSAVARALLGSGLNPGFGIFHRNKYNPMPLADDVMEPFRPFVDEIVYGLYSNGETELTKDVKCHLVDVLTCDTIYDKTRRPLQIGMSMTTSSLGRCYAEDELILSLPILE